MGLQNGNFLRTSLKTPAAWHGIGPRAMRFLGGRPIGLVLGGPWAIAEWMSRDSGTTGLTRGGPDDRHAPGDAG